ncbi:NAD(P)H-binding protein [bacterium SCSIO 12741]|nr:NAD(P)H-binding protein [bacterium SCSIO 12741]
MKIAVTAASGQLGGSIVRELLQNGKHEVVAVARTPEKVDMPGVEVRKGDYAQPTDWPEALKEVDAVLIVSANGEPGQRIGWHRNIIEGAKQSGVQKVVYTSIIGPSSGGAFSPIVQSNRQTEEDIQNSGLDWAIGRNGLYIEPDFEYVDNYVKEGGIINCAGQGKCGYTSRSELAIAYRHLLENDQHSQGVYNLNGDPVSQNQLAEAINSVFGTRLSFKAISVDEYAAERKAALGEFMGTVIAGIYAGIGEGAFNVNSDFQEVVGRAHLSLPDMARQFHG